MKCISAITRWSSSLQNVCVFHVYSEAIQLELPRNGINTKRAAKPVLDMMYVQSTASIFQVQEFRGLQLRYGVGR